MVKLAVNLCLSIGIKTRTHSTHGNEKKRRCEKEFSRECSRLYYSEGGKGSLKIDCETRSCFAPRYKRGVIASKTKIKGGKESKCCR